MIAIQESGFKTPDVRPDKIPIITEAEEAEAEEAQTVPTQSKATKKKTRSSS